MYCKNCGEQMNDNQAICLKCGVKKGIGSSFCENCGKPVDSNASVCLSCGVAVKRSGAGSGAEGDLGGHDKTTMAVVCFFLGTIGIHNFIMGETKKGIIKIVTSCIGVGSILALIDFIKILTDKYVIEPDKFI